ncbi:MAG: Outer membrane porin protein [Herbaspirillum frisingense]|uniref:Outer membrane porin protein n=1 Tax=Herbaspirillum frisingense TaxID=92645 RepID=A0A7V8JUA8_9BURK|nr:MAG: Outer membrane porin protein [Herbaspirillum frisingense]
MSVNQGQDHTFKVATGNGRDTGNQAAVNSGGLQASRIGFRGKEDLGGGLNAEFGLENGFSVDNGAALQGGALFGRRSIVGLSGTQFGTLHLGRRKDFTDEIAGAYSSITPYSGFITAVHANNMDRIGGNRANNMIYYSTPTWGGFRANVSYGFGEAAGSIATGQSLGYGANYDLGPFGIGFGYWQSKLGTTANPTSDQGAGSGAGCSTTLASNAGKAGQTCIKTWILGSHYDFGKVNLRGTYSQVRQPLLVSGSGAAPNFNTAFSATTGTAAFTAGGSNNSKAQILDVGADIELTSALTLTTSFIQSRYDFIGSVNKGKLTMYIAGLQYYLSKRTTLYTTAGTQGASGMYNPGVGTGAPGADNRTSFVAAGIRHTF